MSNTAEHSQKDAMAVSNYGGDGGAGNHVLPPSGYGRHTTGGKSLQTLARLGIHVPPHLRGVALNGPVAVAAIDDANDQEQQLDIPSIESSIKPQTPTDEDAMSTISSAQPVSESSGDDDSDEEESEWEGRYGMKSGLSTKQIMFHTKLRKKKNPKTNIYEPIRDYLDKNPDALSRYLDEHPDIFLYHIYTRPEFVAKVLKCCSQTVQEYLDSNPALLYNHLHAHKSVTTKGRTNGNRYKLSVDLKIPQEDEKWIKSPVEWLFPKDPEKAKKFEDQMKLFDISKVAVKGYAPGQPITNAEFYDYGDELHHAILADIRAGRKAWGEFPPIPTGPWDGKIPFKFAATAASSNEADGGVVENDANGNPFPTSTDSTNAVPEVSVSDDGGSSDGDDEGHFSDLESISAVNSESDQDSEPELTVIVKSNPTKAKAKIQHRNSRLVKPNIDVVEDTIKIVTPSSSTVSQKVGNSTKKEKVTSQALESVQDVVEEIELDRIAELSTESKKSTQVDTLDVESSVTTVADDDNSDADWDAAYDEAIVQLQGNAGEKNVKTPKPALQRATPQKSRKSSNAVQKSKSVDVSKLAKQVVTAQKNEADEPVVDLALASSIDHSKINPSKEHRLAMPYPAPRHILEASYNKYLDNAEKGEAWKASNPAVGKDGKPNDPKIAWTIYEDELTIKYMLQIRDEGKLPATEVRFHETSKRMMGNDNVDRSWTAVKNMWNRIGRFRSNFDERKKQSGTLSTSHQGKKEKEKGVAAKIKKSRGSGKRKRDELYYENDAPIDLGLDGDEESDNDFPAGHGTPKKSRKV